MTAQSTFDTWKRLGEFLVVKYNDGVVKRMKTVSSNVIPLASRQA